MTLRFFSSSPTLAALICTTLVTACGGGSGGGDAGSQAASSTDGKATALSASERTKSATTSTANATTTSSTIVITAAASSAAGTGAIVELWTNGALAGTVEVTGGSYTDYSFTIAPVTPGQKIDVVYTNDATINGADRNLYLRSITIDGVVHPVSEASYDLGFGATAFDGRDVIAGQEGMFWGGAMRFTMPGDATGTIAPKGFYVDSSSGNDGNPGTYDYPFKTLRRLNDVRLTTGDGIYLKCGKVWRESLDLNWLQLVDGSIVAGYGDCASNKAVITGADDFSGGWIRVPTPGNVWMRAVPASTPKISRVFVNGVATRVAQWPNTSASSQGYALAAATSVSSNSRFQLAAADVVALAGRDLRGATVSMRSIPWAIETKTVDSLNTADGYLRLVGQTGYTVDAEEGYILQDKLWMVDAPGEFFHDTTTNVLYVYPADGAAQADMNSATVEGSVRDTVLSLSNRSKMSIKDVATLKGRGNGMQITNAEQATIESVNASDNGLAGIALYQWVQATPGLTGTTVRNSMASGNLAYGIDAGFVSGAQISGNRILETGTLATAGSTMAAIQAGPGANVERNVIDGSGYHGIRYSGSNFSKVTGNSVSNYCKRLSDCGGIYTWNGPKESIQIAGQLSRVEGNQINAATVNLEGAHPGMDHVVAGIYLDDFSRGITVKGNTVQGSPVGAFVHNGSDIAIDTNRFWLNSDSAIIASMDQTDQDYMQRNVFVDNQIVPFTVGSGNLPATPAFKSSLAMRFIHYTLGSSSISTGQNTFARNQVIRLNGTAIQAFAEVSSSTTIQSMNAEQWAALNRWDGTPVSPMTFGVYNVSLGSELIPGGALLAPNGWGMYFVGPSQTGASNVVNSSCTGVCLSLTSRTVDDMLYSSGFPLTANTVYAFSYNTVAAQPVTVKAPYISRFDTPWDSMAAAGYMTLGGRSGEEVRYEAFFAAKTSALSRVNLQLESLNVPVTFSGASVRPVTGITYSKLNDWAAVASSTALDSRTVNCADLGWPAGCRVAGVDGVALSLPFTVPAGSQQLFLRTDSTWRR